MRWAGIVIAGVLLAPVVARGEATVHSKGCRTFITTKIEISGEAGPSKCDAPKGPRGGATKALAKKIRTAILGCSPQKAGGYSLQGCCKVIERAVVRVRGHGKKPRPHYNQIEITTDPDYISCVDGGTTGIWSTAEMDEVYAHEAKHLLGLKDQYLERTDANGNRVTPPVPGHEMDKMGAMGGKLGGGALARADLDAQLVSRGATCPMKCCGTTTSTTIPSGTWSGTLRYVYTNDDTYSYTDGVGAHTRDNHYRTEDLWTIIGTTPAVPPDEMDLVDASWNGSYSLMKNEREFQRGDCVGGEEYQVSSSSGQGTGPQQFGILPYEGTGSVTLGLRSAGNHLQATGTITIKSCNSAGESTQQTNASISDDAGALVSCLADSTGILAPDPGNPRHYAGRSTCVHIETPQLGGADVTDSYVEWDLSRSR
jgi:hypothetical protein